MGSFEEEGELQARARARRAVRSMHVHVPTGRAWRLQVGQGADPGVRHLRRVQAPAASLTPGDKPPLAAQPQQHPRAVADKPAVINGAENSSFCGAAPIPPPNCRKRLGFFPPPTACPRCGRQIYESSDRRPRYCEAGQTPSRSGRARSSRPTSAPTRGLTPLPGVRDFPAIRMIEFTYPTG